MQLSKRRKQSIFVHVYSEVSSHTIQQCVKLNSLRKQQKKKNKNTKLIKKVPSKTIN